MDKDKISVIIPIHNGGKYLNRLYNNINSQTYKNLEIILVENFSKDDSRLIINKLAKNDNRIIAAESVVKGTSLARKKGIELASGEYTLFMDQDDRYCSINAIEEMYNTIKESKSDICQFSVYHRHSFGILSKTDSIDRETIYSADEVRNKEVTSVFGGKNGYITSSVWSKIYSTSLLKNAVESIDVGLFFAEDMYLNICCFFSPLFHSICISPNAYYEWDLRFGFSSKKDSGKALLKDYDIVKPRIDQFLRQNNVCSDVFYIFHLESLYFMRALLVSAYDKKNSEDFDLLYETINSMQFIRLAKDYMNNELDESKKYDDLMFLSSDFSKAEFIERYLRGKTVINNRFIMKLKSHLKKS